MKIFHIDRQRSWTGQIARVALVAAAIRDRGHEAGVIGHPGSKLLAYAEDAGIEALPYPMRGWRTYRSAWRLGKELKRRKVDVIHAHGPKDHQVALFAASRGGARHVLRTKHNHTHLRGGAFSRWMFRRSAKVVALSEFVRTTLLSDGIEPDHVVTIHDGADIERFTPRPRDEELMKTFGIPSGSAVVGNVSSLHRRKGTEEVLRAFRLLLDGPHADNLVCLLVGKRKEQWQPLIDELGIADRVCMPGFFTDVPAALALLDVYVMPSHQEALGTSVLEAMAMELPVVTTDVGGLPESVIPETGVMVPLKDPTAVATAVATLLDDPERRRAMGVAGRERICANFQFRHLVDKTMRLYESLDDAAGSEIGQGSE